MVEKLYIKQLESYYAQYLSNLVLGTPFKPIALRGGKNKPATIKELYSVVDSFLKYEKKEGTPGWMIEWEKWQSKKLGNQRWPVQICVSTEEDYLFLIKKQKESTLFKQLVQRLLKWNFKIAGWLADKPFKVLELQEQWKSICAVVDYLLVHEVKQYYIRSLPVPVHTKFIQQHQSTLLSILRCLQPERFREGIKSLEEGLQLKKKPLLFTIRWLDPALESRYTSGIEILSVPAESLRRSNWHIKEIWLVENETNLYQLPQRKSAMALFAKGYALHELSDIPLFSNCHLFYWGDLDEDGYIMLHQFRGYHPHVKSVFMDEDTVRFHQDEMETILFRRKQLPTRLTDEELSGYELLYSQNGRIEQEKLLQVYMQTYLHEIDLRFVTNNL